LSATRILNRALRDALVLRRYLDRDAPRRIAEAGLTAKLPPPDCCDKDLGSNRAPLTLTSGFSFLATGLASFAAARAFARFRAFAFVTVNPQRLPRVLDTH
jgi:hypothetical protein